MSGAKKRLDFGDGPNPDIYTLSQTDQISDENAVMQVDEEEHHEEATIEVPVRHTQNVIEMSPVSTPELEVSSRDSCARSNGKEPSATHSKELPTNKENNAASEAPVSASTPRKLRQLEILECFTPTKGGNLSKAGSNNTKSTTPLRNPTTHENLTPKTPLNQGQKRKSYGSGSKSSTKKRNSNQSPDTNLTEESNDALEISPDDENVSMDSLQHLSVHLIPKALLKKKFETDEVLSEEELITKLMAEVNQKPNIHFTKDEPSVTFQEPKDFKIVLYTHTVKYREPLHSTFGVKKFGNHNNTIIFYFRNGDIFALTNRNAWQSIQEYCSFQFPCQISNRIASDQGNLQEDTYHITGNVQNSKTTKRSATGGLGKLERITISATKLLRQNSSMFRLKEFRNLHDSKNKENSKVKIQFGLANVRIQKKMNAENIPEILDHFSKICKGQETRTLDDLVETDLDDMPYIQPVSNETATKLNDKLYRILWEYICHHKDQDEIHTFDLADKHFTDYSMAEDFRLIYKGNVISKFTCPPKFLPVFYNIRHHCGNDLEGRSDDDEKKFDNFCTQLAKIKLHYVTKGSQKETSRGIMQLVDGEMHLEGESYWRLMGRWWSLREEYYSDLHYKFIKTIKTCVVDSSNILPKPWDRKRVKTVGDYTSQYRNLDGENQVDYFHHPENGNQGDDPQHYFDMLAIRRETDGKLSLFLIYIYDRFDAGIRFASMRITKSLSMLFKSPNSKRMWQAFSEMYRGNERFSEIFQNISSFKMLKASKMKIEVVAAFATGHERLRIQPVNDQLLISGFLRSSRENSEDDIKASLNWEKDLCLDFNEEFLKTKVLNLEIGVSAECLEAMWKEVNTTGDPINHETLAKEIIKKLIEHGYCTPTNSNGVDGLISGKFLKLRNSNTFKLFKEKNANERLFRALKQFCITSFPGFIHKLECLLIHAHVVKDIEMSVSFTDIHSSRD